MDMGQDSILSGIFGRPVSRQSRIYEREGEKEIQVGRAGGRAHRARQTQDQCWDSIELESTAYGCCCCCCLSSCAIALAIGPC